MAGREVRVNPIVTGALFDFLGYLTSREKGIMIGAKHSTPRALDRMRDWANLRGLSLDEADVKNWQERI